MNVTFLVHYFPPLASPGARRVISFCTYLVEHGHQVTVVTSGKTAIDGALTEVAPAGVAVISVGQASRNVASRANNARTSGWRWKAILFRRRMTAVFGQLIDPRILFAVRICVRTPSEVKRAVRSADVVVSSSPPWPVHLAAAVLTKRYARPWVADYRDQFSGNHIFPGSWLSRVVETSLDKRFSREAAALTVVSEPMALHYERLGGDPVVIENGYNQADFNLQVQARQTLGTEVFTVRYLGGISRDRIPRALFQAMRSLPPDRRGRLNVEFIGEVGLLKGVVEEEFDDLRGLVLFRDPVSYHESIRLMQSADALLIVETSSQRSLSAQGVLTTKLFEYLAAERPIIAEIDENTLIGKVVLASGLALCAATEWDVLARALNRLLDGKAEVEPDRNYIRGFSRSRKASEFAEVLSAVSSPGAAHCPEL